MGTLADKLNKTYDTKQQIAAAHPLDTPRRLKELALAPGALAAVQQRFQTGAASQLEYLQESYNMSSRNTAVETAALSLLSAWETYQGAVNGLASASASS